MSTPAGTTCPTQAEDAIADAWSRAAAWRALTESSDDGYEAQHIYFDQQEDPLDGHAFALAELEELRVAALVLTDPDNGFSMQQGEAEGYVHEGGRVVVIVERLVRASEVAAGMNQQRWLKDQLVTAAGEAFDYLTEHKGPRWCRGFALQQAPVLNHEKSEVTQGVHQIAGLSFDWGVVEPGRGN